MRIHHIMVSYLPVEYFLVWAIMTKAANKLLCVNLMFAFLLGKYLEVECQGSTEGAKLTY